MSSYVELQVTTNFSFLRGASHPEELVARAKELGLAALAITDRNSLAGVVRAHIAAKQAGLRLIIGCRLDLAEGLSVLCYPQDRPAYSRLCRLLTRGKRAAPKGECYLSLDDLLEFVEGQCLVAIAPDKVDAGFNETLKRLVKACSGRVWLAAHCLYRSDDRRRLARLAQVAGECGAALVATNDVHYHVSRRRALHDVVTCIREKCRMVDAGFKLMANAERHLKPASEMLRLFKTYGAAVARTVEIGELCRFNLDELAYEYPEDSVPCGMSAQAHLTALTWKGAGWRYPDGVPEKVRDTLLKELVLIEKLGYAPYFLTVHDIVHYARSLEILCQGRGSAANSAVCYCIGITSVDPAKIDLLFERFISEARQEPPDIDVDFEHERREEVIQYIYQRYGRHRASLTATVITYRQRSAVREVGKVMGLSEDVTGALAKTVWGSHGKEVSEERVKEAGLDLSDPHLARVIELTEQLMGFPRHLSQHVGGFVLTRGALEEVVPIGNAAMKNRTFIEWDKDDIDALKILKVDVLGLGMLTCIRKCFDLIKACHGEDFSLASVPQDDRATYEMLQKADAIGVFQVESRAQMNMLPRLKPEKFYDLVIEVAIVRPGPIQGDMVHPYLRRRDGLEPVEFPSPAPEHGDRDELRNILGRTLGVPLFQEQAMQIAIDAAKFSPDEANQLRRAMATFRRLGTIGTLEDKFVSRLIERGYQPNFAARCFEQIKGFGDYGFPESHAASFALLAYISAWIKCHYPEVFCVGLLNSQPLGFYAPAQIVRDAREHDVEVRCVDVNHSQWDNTLEAGTDGKYAARLGFRQVDGMAKDGVKKIVAARKVRRFDTMTEAHKRTGISVKALERLAAADGFRSMKLDRRQALWEVRSLMDAPDLPLFDHVKAKDAGVDPAVILPLMPLCEHVVADYQTLRLSLKAHPLSFLRDRYREKGIISCADLGHTKDGARVKIAGVVLIRQRPGTARGIVFITLEDETGVANAVVWQNVMKLYRKTIMTSRLLMISGRIQRSGDIIHVIAKQLTDYSGDLELLSQDQFSTSNEMSHHPRNKRIIPKSRDFH